MTSNIHYDFKLIMLSQDIYVKKIRLKISATIFSKYKNMQGSDMHHIRQQKDKDRWGERGTWP